VRESLLLSSSVSRIGSRATYWFLASQLHHSSSSSNSSTFMDAEEAPPSAVQLVEVNSLLEQQRAALSPSQLRRLRKKRGKLAQQVCLSACFVACTSPQHNSCHAEVDR
jgi:hypothetical protein